MEGDIQAILSNTHVAPRTCRGGLAAYPESFRHHLGGSTLGPPDPSCLAFRYCTTTGRTISRGEIGETATAVGVVHCGMEPDIVAVACSGRHIKFMEPF